MDKPNVGDIAVLKSGSQFVIREVHDRHPEHTLPEKFEWYAVGGRPNDGGVWDQYIDHIIPAEQPETEFQKGDKVRLTPKAGGETVIVGEVTYVWDDPVGPQMVDVRIEGDDPTYGGRPFGRKLYNIEKIKPSTVDILNGLGENAFVAHRTKGDYYGYVKSGGKWLSAIERGYAVDPQNIAVAIDVDGFEIIFEGVKS